MPVTWRWTHSDAGRSQLIHKQMDRVGLDAILI